MTPLARIIRTTVGFGIAGALVAMASGCSSLWVILTAIVVGTAAQFAQVAVLAIEASVRRDQRRREAHWNTRNLSPVRGRQDAA
jgi:hypothetical protein